MKILAFDTTGRNASAAYIDGGGSVSLAVSEEGYNHLTALMPMVEKLTANKEIDAVAVSVGPGSFTGIRIGVSTARALMQGLMIPGIAVKTLESFAYAQEPEQCRGFRIVCPIFDARRAEVYAAAYVAGDVFRDNASFVEQFSCAEKLPGSAGFVGIPECAEALYNFLKKLHALCDTLFQIDGNGTVSIEFYGDGIDKYRDIIDGFFSRSGLAGGILPIYVPESERYQRADRVLMCAAAHLNSGGADDLIYNPEKLLPNYLRMAEAERNLENGKIKQFK